MDKLLLYTSVLSAIFISIWSLNIIIKLNMRYDLQVATSVVTFLQNEDVVSQFISEQKLFAFVAIILSSYCFPVILLYGSSLAALIVLFISFSLFTFVDNKTVDSLNLNVLIWDVFYLMIFYILTCMQDNPFRVLWTGYNNRSIKQNVIYGVFLFTCTCSTIYISGVSIYHNINGNKIEIGGIWEPISWRFITVFVYICGIFVSNLFISFFFEVYPSYRLLYLPSFILSVLAIAINFCFVATGWGIYLIILLVYGHNNRVIGQFV